MDLLTTISRLYASEINCGLQTQWDLGLAVWIGDPHNGRRVEELFAPGEFDQAAAWLDQQARALYPGSDYARGSVAK